MPTLRPRTLTARLVVTAVLLTGVVSLLIALVATIAIRTYLTNQLDVEVSQASARAFDSLRHGLPLEPPAARPNDPEGGERDLGETFGQGTGTLTAYLSADYDVGNLLTPGGEFEPLDDQTLGELGVLRPGASIQEVDLAGSGEYRVLVRDVGRSVTLVTGLPTSEVDQTVTRLLGWELMLSLLGVLAAAGAAVFVVRRQLRPLHNVARTAHAVSALPLSSGEIGVTARVPDELTDERTEVGQVGSALNTLLGHVERALDARHRSEIQVRQFVADASHELRTPLATIKGYAELSRRPSAEELATLRHCAARGEGVPEFRSLLTGLANENNEMTQQSLELLWGVRKTTGAGLVLGALIALQSLG